MGLVTIPGSAEPIRLWPSWLSAPYAGPDACYGCGLTPEVMNPGRWVLCRYCDELRKLLVGA